MNKSQELETSQNLNQSRSNHKTAQLVTFKLGEGEYGVDIMKVQEIILLGEITKIPEVPKFIEGVINLRGQVIPIIDLRKKFNLPNTSRTENTRIIVVNVHNKTMGVVVDAVNEVLRMANSNVEETPEAIERTGIKHLKGLVKLKDRLLMLVDMDQLLSLPEMSLKG